MANWHFLPEDPNGGSTGEAFRSTLNNNGFQLADRLARESLQNSSDAVCPGSKLKATFIFKKFTGTAKEDLIKILGLADMEERKTVLGLHTGTSLDHLKDATPLSVLYVNDYNTTGLFGNPLDPASNLRRFLLTLGDRSKQRADSNSGGSYGFGKAVYSESTKINTIFAYTRFDERTDEGINTRFMGCGYFRPHNIANKSYTGRAIFGDQRRNDQGQFVVYPLTNDSAHNTAELAGFDLRNYGNSGTSVLIIEPAIVPIELTHGVETWWWPAILENKMDVMVIDEDGQRHIPKPRKRYDLRPFIDSFDIARGVAETVGPHQHKHSLNRHEGKQLGDLAMVLLDDDAPARGFPEELENTIAQIRSPRMVVQYLPVRGNSPAIAGTFLAADDVEQWLKTSEPPAHNTWDDTSPDLEDFGPNASLAIKAIHKRIKNEVAQFRRSANPPPDRRAPRLKVLEAIMSRLFKVRQAGPPPPPNPGDAVPVHIHFDGHPKPFQIPGNSDAIMMSARFDVSLSDDYANDEAALKVLIDCTIVEDGKTLGDELPLDVQILGALHDRSVDGGYLMSLNKGQKATFVLSSGEYDKLWSVNIAPSVELISSEDAR